MIVKVIQMDIHNHSNDIKTKSNLGRIFLVVISVCIVFAIMQGVHITFYVDRSMIIITVVWAIAEIMRFCSSVHISANLVKKNGQKKRWILSWIFLPKFSKIVWGFSNRYVREDVK